MTFPLTRPAGTFFPQWGRGKGEDDVEVVSPGNDEQCVKTEAWEGRVPPQPTPLRILIPP